MPQQRVFQPSQAQIVSYSDVVGMILNLNTKSSRGPDNIPDVFLRVMQKLLLILSLCSFGVRLQVQNNLVIGRRLMLFLSLAKAAN